jgi:xylulokinase
VTVGIDIGTTATKAVAVAESGEVVARSRVAHALLTPAVDRLEHDAAEAWVGGPQRALAALGVEPLAVAIAALTPSITPVDGAGRPVGPGVLYDDVRGRPEGPYAGSDPTRSPETSELVRWAAATHPAAGYWPAQAVANRATGGPGTIDYATAVSAGPLFDGSAWDAEACATCGVTPDQLPSVRFFGEPIAELAPPGAPPVILGAGSVDALCEQLVAGPLAPGDVLVVLGSTLVVWVAVEDRRDVAGLWTVPRIDGGGWLLGGASNAGGLWIGWADRVLAPADARTAAPGSVPVWFPYGRGERVPLHDPDARAGLFGGAITQGPAELRRAAFEASGFAVRRIIERSGVVTGRIVATGGGSASLPWLAAIADVTGAPVEAVRVPEGAALGAAWLARVAAGLETGVDGASRWSGTGHVVAPEPAWVEPTGRRYERFRDAEREAGR